MGIQISGNYNHSETSYAEQVKEKQAARLAEKGKESKEADKEADVKGAGRQPERRDEYIPSGKSDEKSAVPQQEGQKVSGNSQGKQGESCTANTDKVDREIKKLKEKKQELEQQIRSASGDEEKTRELEKKLAQVEQELKRKDNDTYRRQNTVFSYHK